MIPASHAFFFFIFYNNARLLSLQLGFKTAVGMPFKDIATADSVYLEQVPASDAKAARTALRRMQEVRRRDMCHIYNHIQSLKCCAVSLVRY